MAHVSYQQAIKTCAAYIADRIIENANDNDEDATTYTTDVEVAELYLKDLAEGVSALLADEIRHQLGND